MFQEQAGLARQVESESSRLSKRPRLRKVKTIPGNSLGPLHTQTLKRGAVCVANSSYVQLHLFWQCDLSQKFPSRPNWISWHPKTPCEPLLPLTLHLKEKVTIVSSGGSSLVQWSLMMSVPCGGYSLCMRALLLLR